MLIWMYSLIVLVVFALISTVSLTVGLLRDNVYAVYCGFICWSIVIVAAIVTFLLILAGV